MRFSCNNRESSAPEITIQISDSYLAANLAGREDEFILTENFYEKTIDPTDIELSFPEDEDGKDTPRMAVTQSRKWPWSHL